MYCYHFHTTPTCISAVWTVRTSDNLSKRNGTAQHIQLHKYPTTSCQQRDLHVFMPKTQWRSHHTHTHWNADKFLYKKKNSQVQALLTLYNTGNSSKTIPSRLCFKRSWTAAANSSNLATVHQGELTCWQLPVRRSEEIEMGRSKKRKMGSEEREKLG